MAAKLRQITTETVAWRQARDPALAALADALATGDFSEIPRDPLAAAEALTPGFPVTEETEQAYRDVITSGDQETLASYGTGLELQINVMEAARRTAAVARGSRVAALARMQSRAEDAGNRSDQLDTLFLEDDTPMGYPPEPT